MIIRNSFMPMYAAQRGQETAQVMVVLASPSAAVDNEFAAYLGIIKKPSTEVEAAEAAKWVGVHGSKLSLKQAQGFFPMLTEATYRA